MLVSMDDETAFTRFKRVFLSGILDKAKLSGLLQERVERQSGLKVHELHSYPFLHKLPILPGFIQYTSEKERSRILPYVAEIQPSSEKSDSKPINLDEINLCDTEYFRLNRCVIEGLSKDNKDINNPKFNRLSKCKYHYIIYDKCINRRNKTIDKIIYKYEMDHMNRLPSNKKAEYLEELEKVIHEVKNQLEDSTDQSEKFVLSRSLKIMSDRVRKLKKTYG